MEIFIFNLSWMMFNLYLAFLPVLFSWFLFKMPHKLFSLAVGVLWLLYLPNTIYVVTDIHHLIEQWPFLDGLWKLIVIVQYGVFEIIGLICFLLAFYPFEKIFDKFSLTRQYKMWLLIMANFLMGFAMVIGKIERVNSWDVFFYPLFVITSTLNVFSSYQMVGLMVLFGAFGNFFYFLFREQARKLYDQWFTS